ncbi:MAG: translocation/assembly module TamB domain-containing protein [Candidatus Sericytochromatia bacterium]|nr:translocation/assembly module TamB domain-containing protein [Candidatus Sericytochromatia bacterium]
MSRRWAIALATLALLLVGVVAGLVALSSPRLTTRLAHEAVARFSEALPGAVAFEHVQVLPLEARVSIRGLRVSPRGRLEAPTLAIRRVDLTLDRLALLGGRLHLAEVDVEAPAMRGRHLGAGRYDWDGLLAQAEAGEGAAPLTVGTVRWHAGTVAYDDPLRGLAVTVRGLEGAVTLAPDMRPTRGRLKVAGGQLLRGGVPWSLASAEATLGRSGEQLRLTRLRVVAAGLTLSGQGQLGLGSADAALVGRGGLALSLGQLPAWPELTTWRPGGTVTGDWTLGGTVRDPAASLQLRGEGLRVREVRFRDATVQVATRGTGLTVAQARLVPAAGGVLEASGLLPLASEAPVDVRLNARELDVTRLAAELGLPAPAGVAARVTADLRAAGRGLDPLAWTADGEAEVAGRLATLAGWEPYALRASLAWRARRLALSAAQVEALGARVTAAGEVQLPARQPVRLRLAGAFHGVDVARAARASGQAVYATGRLDGTYDVAGVGLDPLAWQGSGTARFTGAVPPDVATSVEALPVSGGGAWRLAAGVLTLPDLEGRVLGGLARVSGTVPLREPASGTRLTVAVEGVDVQAAGRAFEAPEGLPPARASARLRVAGRRTWLDRVETRLWGGRVTASGRADVGDTVAYALDLRAERLALEGLRRSFAPAMAPLSGLVGARLRVQGRGSRWEVAGPVEARGQARLEAPLGPGLTRLLPVRLVGPVRLTRGGLSTPGLTLTLADARVAVRGTLDRLGRSDLVVEGQAPSLDRVGALLGLPDLHGGGVRLVGHARGAAGEVQLGAEVVASAVALGGVALTEVEGRLQGRWGGRLTLAGRLSGEATHEGRKLSEGWRLPLRYDAPAERPGRGRLQVAGLEVRLGAGRVRGDLGWDGVRREVLARLHTERLTVGDVTGEADASQATIPAGTPIVGSLELAGPVAGPRGTLRAQLGAFRLGQEAFGPSTLSARADGRTVRLDGRLFGGAATVAGTLPFTADPARVVLAFERVRLDPLLAAVPVALRGGVEWPVGGELAGRLEASGPWRRPRELAVKAGLDRFVLRYPELVVANQGPWRLRYDRGRLMLDAFRLVGGGTNLGVRGVVGLDTPTNLTLEGRLDLALLEKISPRQFAGASGRAQLEGTLRGRLGSDDLSGALRLRDGELETRTLPQPIHDLSADLRVTRSRIFLDQLKAGFGPSGRLAAAGGARLGAGGALAGVTLKVDAQEVALRLPGLEAVTNADLTWAWAPGDGRLDGQVRILEGLYSQDVALTPGASRRKARPSLALQSPFVRDTALRVQALLADGFRVRNNVLRGELRGDVLVLGTAAEPILVGRGEALDAIISFQDREFRALEATVDFIDPRVLTPYLHLTANGQIEGVEVTVRANGTPDKLRLELSSTPAMSQTDILTLIATGKTGKELGEAASGGLATASNMLLDRVAGGVARGITEQGVVDVLKVKPGSVDPASPGGASFTVGKRINEQLTVTYTQDITAAPGRPQGRVMIFDYLLTDAVVLKLEQDLGGGFNASARYRIPVR